MSDLRAEETRVTEEPRLLAESKQQEVSVYHRFGNPAEELLILIDEWSSEPGGSVVARARLPVTKMAGWSH